MEVREMTREVRMRRWTEVIRGRQESGQTVKEYCEGNGISEKSYYYWQKRIRQRLCELVSSEEEVGKSAAPMPTFAEVPIQPGIRGSGAAVVVHIGGAAMEIHESAGAAVVETVLRAL